MEEVLVPSDWQLLGLSHAAGIRPSALSATGCLLLARVGVGDEG